MKYQLIIARAVSFFFGFLAGLTGKWWLLWFSLAAYFFLAIALRYVGRVWKIPAEIVPYPDDQR